MASTKVFVSRLQRSFTSQAIHAAIAQAAKKMGYSAPRSEQLEAVENFVSGRDVFLSLPTGGGKSFCFACLPLVFDFLRGAQQQSIVLVVSPLIALMQDQVASLTSKGIKAAYVQGEGGDDAASVSDGEIQVVYMSPETLLTVPKWREMLRQELYQDNVVGLAVDEAHLVEKWGATFRSEFSNISEIRSLIPKNTNIMALTATANLKTRVTVIKTLEMKGCYVLSHNPNKLNIYYEVAPKTDIESILCPIVSQVSLKKRKTDQYIIFCQMYRDTTVLYEALMLQLAEKDLLLSDDNVRICEKFTGCTSPAMKKNILESFTQQDGLVRIVVATVAFGMGLDSPNVRHILHWGPPED